MTFFMYTGTVTIASRGPPNLSNFLFENSRYSPDTENNVNSFFFNIGGVSSSIQLAVHSLSTFMGEDALHTAS